jgi:GT2 family glycosyltransferase
VICTRDRAGLLRRCLEGLRECNDYPRWEAIIVDNGTVDEDALALLRSLGSDSRFRIVRDERAFNYSALCNVGVKHSNGEVVVLLNNDVEPIAASWLTELVTQSQRPGIGLVGAMLYYPNDTIQHAGVVLGLNGIADRPYIGYPRGFRGIDSRLVAVHTVTAMITACASVRRSTYDAVGGMDERLPVEYNDVDLCLRVADLGLRNILTPFAELYHHESASRGYHYQTPATLQAKLDETYFCRKWGDRLSRDPTYNRNLTLRGTAFGLSLESSGAPDRGEGG